MLSKERLLRLIESCERDICHAETLKAKGIIQMPNMLSATVDDYILIRENAMSDFERELKKYF